MPDCNCAAANHNRADYILTVNQGGSDQPVEEVSVAEDGEVEEDQANDVDGEVEEDQADDELIVEEAIDEKSPEQAFEVRTIHIAAIGVIIAILFILAVVAVKARSK